MADVIIVGTSGMLPLKNRFMCSAYVEHNGHAILIDCGEGTQMSMRKLGIRMHKIDCILITHEHADHIMGIPGLLLSMSNGGRVEPVDIFYPAKAEQAIMGLMISCGGLQFKVRFNPLPNDKPINFNYKVVDDRLVISTIVLRHSTVCLGYKLEFYRLPEFQPQKAKELNIPVQYYKFLHSGETVKLPDGRVIYPNQVLGEPRKPLTIVNMTDTLPFNDMVEFSRGADLLIAEGMYGDQSVKHDMNKKGHMLMQDACKLASSAGVKKLFLTHYSPANTNPWQYKDELKHIFKNVVISSDGESTVIK